MSARDDGTRRIRAMTAACENISTEALEAGVVDKLVEAVEAVLHDWHSETGFVTAVRQATGLPLPWEHGDESLAELRAALTLARGEQS